MEMITIKNIKVKHKILLAKSMINHMDITAGETVSIINQLASDPYNYHISEYDHNWMKDCEHISYDVVKIEKETRKSIYYRSTTNDNGDIENPLGLTDAERWFNTLTDENKKFVKELAGFFNPPACAG